MATEREKAFGNQIFFSTNRLQYASIQDKINYVVQMGDRGRTSINEDREVFNLPPIEGGERHFIRGEYRPVDSYGEPLEPVETLDGNIAVDKSVGGGIMEKRDWVTINGHHVLIGGDGGSSGSGGGLSEVSSKPITAITEQAIEKVPYINIDGFTDEQCKFIQEQHKELLRYARDNNSGNEVAFVFRNDLTDRNEVKGSADRLDLGKALVDKGTGLVVMHNHPRNSSYSMNDIALFLNCDDLRVLTIVKNNGAIESLAKTTSYNKNSAITVYKRQFKKYVRSNLDAEINTAIYHFLSGGKGGIQWTRK